MPGARGVPVFQVLFQHQIIILHVENNVSSISTPDIKTISQVFQHQIVLEEENYAQCQQYCKYDKIAQYSIYHVIHSKAMIFQEGQARCETGIYDGGCNNDQDSDGHHMMIMLIVTIMMTMTTMMMIIAMMLEALCPD